MRTIELMIATTPNNGIGYENNLPWGHNEKDMQLFKQVTESNVVVMGRNTWNSIPGTLPGRVTVVISKNQQNVFGNPNYIINNYDPNAIITMFPNKNIIVIGGSKVYEAFKDKVDVIHHSLFKDTYECDTFFDVTSVVADNFVITQQNDFEDFIYTRWQHNKVEN